MTREPNRTRHPLCKRHLWALPRQPDVSSATQLNPSTHPFNLALTAAWLARHRTARRTISKIWTRTPSQVENALIIGRELPLIKESQVRFLRYSATKLVLLLSPSPP